MVGMYIKLMKNSMTPYCFPAHIRIGKADILLWHATDADDLHCIKHIQCVLRLNNTIVSDRPLLHQPPASTCTVQQFPPGCKQANSGTVFDISSLLKDWLIG